jgi:hypothetical protein
MLPLFRPSQHKLSDLAVCIKHAVSPTIGNGAGSMHVIAGSGTTDTAYLGCTDATAVFKLGRIRWVRETPMWAVQLGVLTLHVQCQVLGPSSRLAAHRYCCSLYTRDAANSI